MGRLDTVDLLFESLLDTEGIELTSEADDGRPAARAASRGQRRRRPASG